MDCFATLAMTEEVARNDGNALLVMTEVNAPGAGQGCDAIRDKRNGV